MVVVFFFEGEHRGDYPHLNITSIDAGGWPVMEVWHGAITVYGWLAGDVLPRLPNHKSLEGSANLLCCMRVSACGYWQRRIRSCKIRLKTALTVHHGSFFLDYLIFPSNTTT